MGSPCLFTRQKALKLGYFYWLHIKIRITFIQKSLLLETLKILKLLLFK